MNNDLISRSALLDERPEYLNTDHIDVEKALLQYETGFVNGFKAGVESAKPKWISVEERLPTELGEVLICLYRKTTIAWYGGNGGFEIGSGAIFWAGDGTVTHWLPMPEPPKEGT